MDKAVPSQIQNTERLLQYLLYIVSSRMAGSKTVNTPDGFCAYINITPTTIMFDRDDLSVIKALPASDMAEICHLVDVIESCLKGGEK